MTSNTNTNRGDTMNVWITEQYSHCSNKHTLVSRETFELSQDGQFDDFVGGCEGDSMWEECMPDKLILDTVISKF